MATSEIHHSEVPLIDRLSLKGKNFLVTGGAQGIGFACAKAIAQQGGGIAVLDARPQPVEEFATLKERYGVPTFYAQTDVSDKDSYNAGFEKAVEALGTLNGGILAAGIILDEKIVSASWEASQKLININVMGTIWGVHLLAKHMTDKKAKGSIVLTASLSGQGVHMPVQAVTAYNASKAAVKGIVGPLATELGPSGIRVNSISPGFIITPLTAGLEKDNPAIYNWFVSATPVQRVGTTSDVTPMVVYLLSDASGFSTGGDHVITGGIHVGRADPLDLTQFQPK